MTLIQLVIIALIVEAVVETIQMPFKPEKVNKWLIVSMSVGILLAFTVKLDILQILGFDETIPYLGIILTGILLSRGSNWMHDLIKKLEGFKGLNLDKTSQYITVPVYDYIRDNSKEQPEDPQLRQRPPSK